MRTHLVIVFTILLLSSVTTDAQNEQLRSGPMVGHVNMMEANIWVQTTSAATVRIEYRDSAEPGTVYSTQPVQTKHAKVYTATLVCDNVLPGRTYNYTVLINDRRVNLDYPTVFRTQPIWKYRSDDQPSASIMIGSCFYVNEPGYERWNRQGTEQGYGSEFEILDAMKRTPTDVMLWLGDNVYLREADWNSRTGIMHRFTHTRSHPKLQPLLADRAHYAIWDDHDFGPNNSNSSFWAKDITLEAHQLFWPNPSFGVGGKPGSTSTFELLDVQVFMLDNRYYRSPGYRDLDKPTILGKHQVEWLIDALASSTATFKIIAVGSQFLATDKRKEGFIHAPEERQYIIDQITKNKIRGVIFVSGDVHGAELMKLDREGTYPIYEFTSSALTAGANANIAEQPSDNRVEGTAYGKHNFGVISVSGQRKSRKLTLQLMDKDGKEVWKREIEESKVR